MAQDPPCAANPGFVYDEYESEGNLLRLDERGNFDDSNPDSECLYWKLQNFNDLDPYKMYFSMFLKWHICFIAVI